MREERISGLAERQQKSLNLKNREKRLKKKKIRDSENWEVVRKDPTFITLRVPEGEEKEGNERVLEETMTKNVLNLAKDTNLQIQEAT